MRAITSFNVFIFFTALMSTLIDATTRIPSRDTKSIPRPASRFDWHHEYFVKLHSASLQSDAQSIFGYWCGPTLGGYCGSMSFNDINPQAVTHVPFAFAEIATDGTVSYTYDQGSVSQYNTSILIKQGIMPGLSMGGSATNADNCLNNIAHCVATLCATLTSYEHLGSPFYFVDSDFEKPYAAQMPNLITFWRQFHEQCPGYLMTMAPECAYLQLDCLPGYPGCTYCDTYASVVNTLGPNGDNIIYKINIQDYNNAGCSINYQMGQVGFYNDTAKTWITSCTAPTQSGYLGLREQPEILGIGYLAADADGAGYAKPNVVTQSLQVVNQYWGTRAGAMFWDTLTDYNNVAGRWVTSSAMAAVDTGSSKPTHAPTHRPTAASTQKPTARPTTLVPTALPTTRRPSISPTHSPTLRPSSSKPTVIPTHAPTGPTSQPSSSPTQLPTINNPQTSDALSSGIIIAIILGGLAVVGAAFMCYRHCTSSNEQKRVLVSTRDDNHDVENVTASSSQTSSNFSAWCNAFTSCWKAKPTYRREVSARLQSLLPPQKQDEGSCCIIS